MNKIAPPRLNEFNDIGSMSIGSMAFRSMAFLAFNGIGEQVGTVVYRYMTCYNMLKIIILFKTADTMAVLFV